jgi:hypothetical protein
VAGSWPSTLRRSREAPTARRRCAAAPAVIRYAYVVENLERSIDNHVERLGVGRYGFHHRAVTTDRFDEDLARYSRMGYDEAFSDVLPSGARVVHADARRDLPCCRARRAHQGAGAPLHGHLPRGSRLGRP